MSDALKWSLIALTILVGVVLAVHDLPYVLSPDGRCAAMTQPTILLGASPTMTTALICAGAP